MVDHPPRERGPRQFTAPTPADGPTIQFPRYRHAETEAAGFAGDDGPTAPHSTYPPRVPTPTHPVAPPLPPAPAYAAPPAAPRTRSRRRKAVIAVGGTILVAAAGLIGAEVLVRNHAESVVADTVKCATGDTSTVSFATMPPILWQAASGTYKSIRIQTSGNRIRGMRGMPVVIDLHDVRPAVNGSAGSVGSAEATLTWSLDGIKETLRAAVPVAGKLLTDVTASPTDGTITLGNFLASVTVKPKTLNGTIALDVVRTEGPGRAAVETLQPALDAYMAKQTLPLGLHVDQLSVTDQGVNAHLTSANASLPSDSEKACYPTS
ncbi:DUF2993 domain-containing protein [Mycobacterium sp. SMC-13]|uniref:LmeA family phospholipid-binding protein n=1 Tax=Mycobacterium sp. SMC-13 TaxID=3381626 RepID=UPI0038771728